MATKLTTGGLLLAGCLMLTGCAALSAVSALSSVTPGVSASLQVGDKEAKADDVVVGKKESSEVKAQVSKIKAKESKVDQSSQKKDQKTEIGEVKGDVKVVQGPSGGMSIFLMSGWILLALIPLLILLYLWRRRNA